MATVSVVTSSHVTDQKSTSNKYKASGDGGIHFEEYEGVTLRNSSPLLSHDKSTSNQSKFAAVLQRRSENVKSDMVTLIKNNDNGNKSDDDSEKSRYSDTELFKDNGKGVTINADDGSGSSDRPVRKYHSKSFSLSENRIAGNVDDGSNVFQQNRELWEKRVELNSQNSLSTPRILTRNRIAPDLVMDLPLTTPEGSTRSSRDSLDVDIEELDMTSAERFAKNQSTLKKNERYSSDSQYDVKKEVKLDMKIGCDKPKAEVKPQQEIVPIKEFDNKELKNDKKELGMLDEVLHISEDGIELRESKSMKDLHKSPIPLRNTQKFVSQFADLHLTGGCLTKSDAVALTSTSTNTLLLSQSPNQTQQVLSSFKPQVKVKPHILKKPLVLPPTTPEMTRKLSHPE